MPKAMNGYTVPFTQSRGPYNLWCLHMPRKDDCQVAGRGHIHSSFIIHQTYSFITWQTSVLTVYPARIHCYSLPLSLSSSVCTKHCPKHTHQILLARLLGRNDCFIHFQLSNLKHKWTEVLCPRSSTPEPRNAGSIHSVSLTSTQHCFSNFRPRDRPPLSHFQTLQG